MTWVAVGGSAVSLIGGALGSKNAKKANNQNNAFSDAQLQRQRDWQTQDDMNSRQRNTEQQVIDNKQIKDNANWQLDQNRVNQTSDFGSSIWSKDANGGWNQTTSLNPSTKASLDQLRGKYSGVINSIGNGSNNTGFTGNANNGAFTGSANNAGFTGSANNAGFTDSATNSTFDTVLNSGDYGTNNAVLQAMRDQYAPIMQQQRDAENARMAAMGLSTGSGQAWGSGQDALNRSANDMEQKAIISGNDAWLKGRANTRNDAIANQSFWKGNQDNALSVLQANQAIWQANANNNRADLGANQGIWQDNANSNRADLGLNQNIWQGNANNSLALDANARANLGAMTGAESAWGNASQQPDYFKTGGLAYNAGIQGMGNGSALAMPPIAPRPEVQPTQVDENYLRWLKGRQGSENKGDFSGNNWGNEGSYGNGGTGGSSYGGNMGGSQYGQGGSYGGGGI